MHCGLTWSVGISTVLQRSLKVPLHDPNDRLLPAVRAMQGDCQRVHNGVTSLPGTRQMREIFGIKSLRTWSSRLTPRHYTNHANFCHIPVHHDWQLLIWVFSSDAYILYVRQWTGLSLGALIQVIAWRRPPRWIIDPQEHTHVISWYLNQNTNHLFDKFASEIVSTKWPWFRYSLVACKAPAITWTNAALYPVGHSGTYFNEIIIKIHQSSFREMQMNMSAANCRPFCLGSMR